MFVGTGIITPNKEHLFLCKEQIISYLYSILTDEDKIVLELFKKAQSKIIEDIIINYFVSFKDYVIILDHCVYYREYSRADLSEYTKRHYIFREVMPREYTNGKIRIKERFDVDNPFVRRLEKNLYK